MIVRVAILLILTVSVTCADQLYVSTFKICNDDLVEEFRETYMSNPGELIDKYQSMLNSGKLDVTNVISTEIISGGCHTNSIKTKLFYMESKGDNIFQLKSDLEEGRIIEYTYLNKTNNVSILSFKSTRLEATRAAFEAVPGWDIGKPTIVTFDEFVMNNQIFFGSQWRLIDLSIENDCLYGLAIRLVKSGKS